MTLMQARPPSWHAGRSRDAGWPARLALWLATVLFALQVGLHAAMPAHMNMAQMMASVLNGPVGAHGTGMAGMPPHQPHAAPEAGNPEPDNSGPHEQAGHADQLCCMPPLAMAPVFWTPPLLLPERPLRAAVRALAEALRVVRATARGPPRGTTALFSVI